MKTQSIDTHPDTERIMIRLIGNAPLSKRFRLVQSLTQSTLWASLQAWQQKMSEQEVAIHFVSCCYGSTLGQHVQEALKKREQWHIQPADLLAIILPVIQAFDELNVSSYLGGSIASSLHGMQQMAQDIDLVVGLREHHLPKLVNLLKQNYVLDQDTFQGAIRCGLPLPLIHLDSLMKIDIIVPKHDAFETSMHQFITAYVLDERYPPFPLASANEMILFKLQRYAHNTLTRHDGMRDDAQWNDILGMLKVQGPNIPVDLLEEWAKKLNISEFLGQALVDAGYKTI